MCAAPNHSSPNHKRIHSVAIVNHRNSVGFLLRPVARAKLDVDVSGTRLDRVIVKFVQGVCCRLVADVAHSLYERVCENEAVVEFARLQVFHVVTLTFQVEA